MSKPTLEAKVKDTYRMGPVIAFSGHEFVRNEWRDVPVGFGPAALAHPLLDVREKESQEEIRVTSQDHLAGTPGTADETAASEPRTVLDDQAVTAVTEPTSSDPAAEPSAEQPPDPVDNETTAEDTLKDAIEEKPTADQKLEEMVKEKPQRTRRTGQRSRKE